MTQPIALSADVPSANAVDALYGTGHWLYSQQRTAHAVAVFRAMIHLAPHDERGWLALGACHEADDQVDIALQLYSTASSIATAPRCELAKARILRARGMSEEARRAVAEASRIAEELRDEDLCKLVAAERVRS